MKTLPEKIMKEGLGTWLKAKFKSANVTKCQWLTPVILATQEAEIKRIVV
jgi:hypothetical protein